VDLFDLFVNSPSVVGGACCFGGRNFSSRKFLPIFVWYLDSTFDSSTTPAIGFLTPEELTPGLEDSNRWLRQLSNFE